MQQHEKDKLEERIVAYLEGELDPAAGKQLLTEVAKNTESRALFKSHESLNALINAARVPMEVPLEAKRSIAERIPGLIAFIPGLLGGAQAIPVLTQSGNSLFGFLAKIPLSTAISVGTSVAVLTTAGVIVKNKMDANADADRKAKVVLMQNQSKVSDGNQYYMAPLPAKDVAVPNVGNASATVVGGQGSTASNNTSNASGSVPPVATSVEHSHFPGVPAKTLAAVASGMEHAASAHAANGSDRISNSGKSDKPRAIDNSANAAIADKSIATKESAKDIRQPASQNSNARELPTTTTPPAVDPVKEAPPAAISEVSATTMPVASAKDIWTPRASYLGTLPGDDGSLVIHPFVKSEVRWLMLPTVKNNPSSGIFASNTNSPAALNYVIGFDAVISESLSLRFEGGPATFGQFRDEQPIPDQIDGIPHWTTYSRVELNSGVWTTAGVVYALDLGLPYQFDASADAGAVWMPGGGVGTMAGLGISTTFDLMKNLSIRPEVNYHLALIPEAQSKVPTGYVPDGIVDHRELSQSGTLTNSSIGVNIGFIIRF